jgi:uncharacterized LabA/DUF88 family protein
MVFIDGSNFCHSLKQVRSSLQIDLQYLINKFVGNRNLIRVYYYNAPVNQSEVPEQYKSQQAFFIMLKKSVNYLEIKLGKLE